VVKNKRVILVLIALAVVAGGSLLYILSWYRSGKLPAGPSDFFDAGEMERSTKRLESFRLPVEKTIALCAAVTNHTAAAESVRFTNPTSALAQLADLQRDLATLEAGYSSHVEELGENSPGQWQAAYQNFLETAHSAYADGVDLARLLARTNWQEHSYRLLRQNVVKGKTLSGRAREYPPWRAHMDLRNDIYSSFDEAYGLRDEYDTSILARKVITPNPPLLRWYFARRYESLVPIPSPPCADPLQAAADQLEDFSADVRHADPEGVLDPWRFPNLRASYLRLLADIMGPLHQAREFEEWVDTVDRNAGDIDNLIRQTQAGAENPDPGIKIQTGSLLTMKSAVDSGLEALRARPTAMAAKDMLDSLQSAASSDPELFSCFAAGLLPYIAELESLLRVAQEAMSTSADPDGEIFVNALRRVSDASEKAEKGTGKRLHDGMVRDIVDRWCANSSGDIEDAAKVAMAIRAASTAGLIRDDVLPELADFLESLSAVSTLSQRETLAGTWDSTLRSRAASFPNLVIRVNRHIGDLQRLAAIEEIHRLSYEQQWDPLRKTVEEILNSGNDSEWQTYSDDLRAVLMILDLPGRFGELRLRDLKSFAESNADILPGSPALDAIHANLFRVRVQPLIDYAGAVSRIGTDWTPAECIAWIERAWVEREQTRKIYGAWDALDREFAERIAFSTPACVPGDAGRLYRLVDLLDEMKTWTAVRPEARDTLGLQRDAFAMLADLLSAETSGEDVAARTREVREQLTRIAALPPEANGMLSRFEQQAQFELKLAGTPNSYRQIAVVIDDEKKSEGDDAKYIENYLQGMRALHPVVEKDMGAIRSSANAGSLLGVAVLYANTMEEDQMPERLRSYAASQAGALRRYIVATNYIAHAIPGEQTRKEGMRIAYRRISESLEAMGYGRRFKGHGTGFSFWIKSRGIAATLLEASWKDNMEDGHLELSDIRAVPGAFSWSWGDSIEIGVDIYHTTDGNRDVVPDSGGGRSRWNPFNYGQYRAETNAYSLARFDSLETLVRNCMDSLPVEGPPILTLDPYLMPGMQTGPPMLQLLVEGLPEGRDFDWPDVLSPLSLEDVGQIRNDLEATIENLMQEFGK
jgi:hypothetical protein